MRLDLATRTLFAEFQDSVFARTALARDIAASPTFVRKRVKGKVYWYQQRYVDAQYRQQYHATSSARTDAAIEEQRKELRRKKQQLKRMFEREAQLSAMLRRGGVPAADRRIATVLARLADAQLIDEGGVLIGTLAYMTYAGALGADFIKESLKTNDIDIVRDAAVEIAITPAVDIQHLLGRSGITFHAIPGLDHTSLPSSLSSSEGIRVDLLVPQRGRPKGVVPVPGITGVGGLELPFLDFVIDEPMRTVMLTPTGGIAVRVPDPARFAIHKLIVAARRPVSESAKSAKDREQAAQLIQVLSEERPAELTAAFRTARRRGKKWETYLTSSLKRLPDEIRLLVTSA